MRYSRFERIMLVGFVISAIAAVFSWHLYSLEKAFKLGKKQSEIWWIDKNAVKFDFAEEVKLNINYREV